MAGTAGGSAHAPRARTAAVVAAIVVLALLLSGIVPGFRIAPAASHPAVETEREAAIAAAAFARTAVGGPWTLVGAVGAGSWSGGPLGSVGQEQLVGTFSACGAHRPLGETPVLVATPGPTYAAGLLSAWAFGYYAAAGNGTVRVVLVQGGSAVQLATSSGPACPEPAPPVVSFAGAVDSPAVGAAVARSDVGAAYIPAHPRANVTYELVPGYSTGTGWAPLWFVTFTACGPSGAGSAGVLYAFVDAATGTVETAATQACPVPPAG